jgi:hypothetical protein
MLFQVCFSCFIVLLSFWMLKMLMSIFVMRKSGLKAPMNLNAHFTFLALDKHEPLWLILWSCELDKVWVGSWLIYAVIGNAFNIALVYILVDVILVWESFHIIGQEVPRLRCSMILLYLQWQEFVLCLELSNIWCRHLFPRGMRHLTYILSRALLIFAFTLTFNHFKMLMIGAMGA